MAAARRTGASHCNSLTSILTCSLGLLVFLPCRGDPAARSHSSSLIRWLPLALSKCFLYSLPLPFPLKKTSSPSTLHLQQRVKDTCQRQRPKQQLLPSASACCSSTAIPSCSFRGTAGPRIPSTGSYTPVQTGVKPVPAEGAFGIAAQLGQVQNDCANVLHLLGKRCGQTNSLVQRLRKATPTRARRLLLYRGSTFAPPEGLLR